jgi:hypothetical protein
MSTEEHFDSGATLTDQIRFSRFYGVQVQIALAYQVTEILKTQLFLEIDSGDLLDAMASAGVHLTAGGALSSEAYMRVIS